MDFYERIIKIYHKISDKLMNIILIVFGNVMGSELGNLIRKLVEGFMIGWLWEYLSGRVCIGGSRECRIFCLILGILFGVWKGLCSVKSPMDAQWTTPPYTLTIELSPSQTPA